MESASGVRRCSTHLIEEGPYLLQTMVEPLCLPNHAHITLVAKHAFGT